MRRWIILIFLLLIILAVSGCQTFSFYRQAIAGQYEIFFVFTPNANRATNVPVTIAVEGQAAKAVTVNQQTTDNDGLASLGKFQLPKGTGTSVTISNTGTDGYVVVDGLQIVAVK